MATLDKELPLDFVEAIWREMQGGTLADDHDKGLINDALSYRIGANPNAELSLMQSSATKAMSDMIWTKLTTGFSGGMASRGQARVIFEMGIVCAIRFGMYLQRRAQEKGALIR